MTGELELTLELELAVVEGTLELETGVVGAMHLVQIVEVDVVRTVETLWVTSVVVTVPEVLVLVTGQVVKVV